MAAQTTHRAAGGTATNGLIPRMTQICGPDGVLTDPSHS